MHVARKVFDRFPNLTTREIEVALGISEGQTNAEIGGALGITEKTVKNTANKVFLKMDVSNRVQVCRNVLSVAHGFDLTK